MLTTTPAEQIAPTALPALDRAAMRHFFESAYKERTVWKIGFEYEMSGVLTDTFQPLPFRGERSIQFIINKLRERYGEEGASWEGDYCYGLRLPYGDLSLEPGGQVEFSSPPVVTVSQMEDALQRFIADVTELGEQIGVHFYIAGVNPFHKQEEMPWSEKGRYKIMREYLIQRGRLAHYMMQQTMSLQFNIDYENERDAVRKFKAGIALYPTLEFLTYNSYIYDGKILEEPFRPAIWKETDPDRSGLPPQIESFDDYIEYVLDVPIFLLVREKQILRVADGTTFRQYLANGWGGLTATYADWTQHLSTLFPEVRFKKNALELRMFDGNRPEYLLAFAAIVRSLFYNEAALDTVLARGWGRSWEDASDLLQLAQQFANDEDRPYLAPLFDEIQHKEQPGLTNAAFFREHQFDRNALLAHLRIR